MNAPTRLAELPSGFAAPGLASQAVFRRALEALSRPGRCQSVTPQDTGVLAPPAGMSLALAALLLTLLDGETTLWLAPSLDAGLVRSWLGFHTGVLLVARPEDAAHLAVRGGELDLALWGRIGRGSDERPQDGATLLVEVDALDHGSALSLSGPGIASHASLSVAGIAPEVWAARAADHARYPLGADLLLCHGERFAGLPRSTRLVLED
jgi:alpha-D-ribose 1-methylphosphonate 5-triphosphate synthase subunit PhnH